MTKEIELEWGARRLAALQWGAAEENPVLALHGWMDHAGSFGALAPLLTGCRTVAVDLPGHGNSALDPGGDQHHYIDGVVAIDGALAALGWERADLLGHSMGAGLALLYAAARPTRVRSLISLDMLGPITDRPADFPARLGRALVARADYRERRRHFPTREEAIAARTRTDLSARSATLLAERGLERTGSGWAWRGDRRLTLPSLVRLTETQVRAALRAVDLPVLVIRAAGRRGEALESLFERRFRALARARLMTLPGGHHLHLENPSEVARAILEFLATVH